MPGLALQKDSPCMNCVAEPAGVAPHPSPPPPHTTVPRPAPGLSACGYSSGTLAIANLLPSRSGSPFPASVQDPGLHVWRVEKLKPVPVARENQGIFFSGDSYLVLHNGPDELSHLHLWIGQQSSRDEQGACAVLAVHLNSRLGERPVQHREVQGNESDLFMSYFPRGLKYQWAGVCRALGLPPAHSGGPSGLQEGGVESAFHKTSPGATPAAVRKLYQVKGKKNIRATERALSWDSFNTGDCFILDLGQNIFAWCGGKSNILERNKARDLALAIRDSERQGKAQVEIVTDGEEPAEMIQVLGPKPALKEGNPEEDLKADWTNAHVAALYKVSDATGQMNLTKVADSSPFALELLIPDDCFVLDNGLCGKIYIWKGRKANEKERQAALRVAEDFISRMRYAPNTQVEILPQGRESLIFKQFFKDWK
ncbi:Macrophage-capping protein [Pteropus alecto]|uniref:Macrophage-capping protein n=1 Tax=Pteropus alecto TaxID=9402 RepID=L5KAY7_PTEAL|nr:Macrophage-capping protein [Pteropus alecto]